MFRASGEEVLSAQFEEFVKMLREGEQPARIQAIKRHLQPLCGQSRFRQRLLLPDGQMLSDDLVLRGPMDIQLILQPFHVSSEEEILQLQDAARDSSLPVMEQLLTRPQDPDLEFGGRPPALHAACASGSTEAARLLLEANADKDKCFVGKTPMFFASLHGQFEAVRLLLEVNADTNRTTNIGPIHVACCRAHLNIIQLLLEANADKDKCDCLGRTPIWLASMSGRSEVVRVLLEANADKDKAGYDDATPIYTACAEGYLDVVQLLLEAKANKG